MAPQYALAELHHYPVKSMQGNRLSQMHIDDFGPQWDRRFMLVDESGQFLSQRTFPLMSQLHAAFDGEVLSINGPEGLVLAYRHFGHSISARVWSDQIGARVSDHSDNDAQLSALLQENVRLVYMPDSVFRQVDRDFFAADRRVSFADGFPFLLTNTASLSDLNARLADPVDMRRFRPNIVVAGDLAFQEDAWTRIRIGAVEFELVKPCSRCVLTTIDENGKKGKEPLRTLASYRKSVHGVCFGQNMVALNEGLISLQDRVEVLEAR